MTRQVSGFVITTFPDFAITSQSAYFLTLKWQIQNYSCPAVFGPSHVTAVPASHWWRAGRGRPLIGRHLRTGQGTVCTEYH